MEGEVSFKLERWNPRRVARGAEGAQIAVLVDGEPAETLWMSKSDIVKNIKNFGEHPALVEALALYRGGK